VSKSSAPAAEKSSSEQKLADGSVRVVLLRPLQVPDKTGIGSTAQLTFREPFAEDIEIAGCPATIDSDSRGEPKIVFDERKMNAMLSRLSGVPLPFIHRLRGNDWTNCAWAITPFFMPGERT
jgi:hypothetical protein